MLYKFQYHDEKERTNLINQHSNFDLIEIQNITEGNFLIFSDEPLPVQIVYTQVPSGEIQSLKEQSESLQQTVDSILLDILPSILG